jgi:hypothetical protein
MLFLMHFMRDKPVFKCCFSSTMKRDLIRLLAGLLAITGLFSCAPPSAGTRAGRDFVSPVDGTSVDGIPANPSQVADGLRSGDHAINRNNIDAILNNSNRTAPKAEESRPGLATGWGNEKKSSLSGQSFVRASSKPAGTDVIYYNDRKGVEAMTGSRTKVEGSQTAAGGLVEWGVKGRLGFLDTYKEGYYGQGRRLVAGAANSSYTIVVRNRSKSTLEIVASVDGLDVMDGKAASFSKRGYLIEPGDTLEIDGFRTSEHTVAEFKFSSVSNSYANLHHGDTRNVGVLGIAVFTQKGVNPWTWMPTEINRRSQAQAFAEAPRS